MDHTSGHLTRQINSDANSAALHLHRLFAALFPRCYEKIHFKNHLLVLTPYAISISESGTYTDLNLEAVANPKIVHK